MSKPIESRNLPGVHFRFSIAFFVLDVALLVVFFYCASWLMRCKVEFGGQRIGYKVSSLSFI